MPSIRDQLLDLAVTRKTVAVHFERDGQKCVCVGKVTLVDATTARISCARGDDPYLIRVTSVRQVVELDHPSARVAPGTAHGPTRLDGGAPVPSTDDDA